MARRGAGRRRALAAAAIVVVAAGAVALYLVLRPRPGEFAPLVSPSVRIEVLNGCGEEGAADRVAGILRRRGYRVESTGNAEHFHYRRDLVVVREGDGGEAATIAEALGGAAVVEQRMAAYPYEITVIVGTPHPLVPGR